MSNSSRIAVDAMGGDEGLAVMLAGVARARRRFEDMRFILVGDEAQITEGLKSHPNLTAHSEIVHAPEVVGFGRQAELRRLRRAKTTSMGVAIDMVKQGRAGAAVSLRQYRRADGDGQAVAAHAAGDRPPGARRDAADARRQ